MLVSSYFTTSFRGLIRQKTYLLINLMGLAVGIAAYMVIMLYVVHEKTFDHHITERANIYRVVEIQNEPGVGNQHVAITMGPLAQQLKARFPQITNAARILPASRISSVKHANKLLREPNMLYADADFIQMFSVKFIRGNEHTALKEPKTVVISEEIAVKYFGSVDKAYNGTLLFDNQSFKVEGIMENQTRHSHLYFKMLLSMASIENTPDFEWMKHWGANSFVTYIQLDKPQSAQIIESSLPGFLDENVLSKDEGWDFLEMYLQPLNEIYLKSQHIKFQLVSVSGDAITVSIFLIVAILILLIACVNYINISLARSVKQAREVGMRKVLGADRRSLVYRYISESFIVTLVAVILSIVLLELVLPEINKILGTDFYFDYRNPLFNIGLLVLLILISLISGAYPAFYLSRFQPVSVLKGGIASASKSGFLRKALMVFQFAISVGLIFSILMINDQIRYIQKKDLGINYANSIFLFFGKNDYRSLDYLKSTLKKNPDVLSVSGSSFINGVSGAQGPIFVDDSVQTKLTVRFGFVDEDFFRSMGIRLIEGRNFNPSRVGDSAGVVILNKSAVNKLGWDNIAGKRLLASADGDSTVQPEVIGLIDDYHYYSLRSLIEPAAYFYIPARFNGAIVRYSAGADKQKMEEYIRSEWIGIFPDTPFQTVFADQYISDSYKSDLKIRSLFVYFTIISMFLSCLGLYGLTSLLIEQKTKIIGIKKVLGSPVYAIVFSLIKEYLLLVMLAGLISIPVSLILIREFLDNYPYRVEISIVNIIIALLVAVLIAFVTIVFKAGKTASSNPLEALKYE